MAATRRAKARVATNHRAKKRVPGVKLHKVRVHKVKPALPGVWVGKKLKVAKPTTTGRRVKVARPLTTGRTARNRVGRVL